ncbi:acyl-CoA dehydrogenase family protein [Amycolatopsis sp. K13G38]|uniref:Acyl-CoA dehydrogenase family protein n=1 Tax=Amycolatopsis acididurans TaxID=2724524 RepID=A0ABX1J0U5_9PSEU|nr:acyl-CoA dehydrogenase family protein [Amycolatopsis acididurans]NKQ51886.1 acyl-CoA dehydrogenase family protein [Amycolatopsis acididurans]
MEWSIPSDVEQFVKDLDTFIDAEIRPLEAANPEFFDHRREFSRTDVDRGGIPTRQWRELMGEARRRADAAGFYRYPLPAALGGRDGTNLAMAVIREHLARRGPGLHAELSHEASVVANLPLALVLHEYGTPEQRERYLDRLVRGEIEMAFGLTEPGHGSDATYLETTARRDGDDWIIEGAKRFNSVVDVAEVDLVFARTSGEPGKAAGITAFLVPTDAPGFEIPYYHWTFNMPSDHAEVRLDGVRVPSGAVLGEVGRGLDCAQLFVHENRIRQAASSLGAAQFCIDESARYAQERVVFGRPLHEHQGIQWQLVELQTEAELVRNTLYKTAWLMDELGKTGVSDKVAMVNYRGNQLACEAADRAMQIHGGVGYTRHKPFEFIYRHHRRYRITEGSDELQKRRIAAAMFSFGRLGSPK